MPSYQPGHSPLIRLTPLTVAEIPSHPDLTLKPKHHTGPALTTDNQPSLLPFITTLLNDGLAFLSDPEISKHYDQTTVKNVKARSFSRAELERDVPWHLPPPENTTSERASSRKPSVVVVGGGAGSTSPPPPPTTGTTLAPPNTTNTTTTHRRLSLTPSTHSTTRALPSIRRTLPSQLRAEHHFARFSLHPSLPSHIRPGTASWSQFLFGLLHKHSEHEAAFTPNLFHASPVVGWDGQVRKLEEEGGLGREGWSEVRCGVWEMCHALPGVLEARCFGVLVVGGRVMSPNAGGGSSRERGGGGDDDGGGGGGGIERWKEGERGKFVVVTVPVVLKGQEKAFYASGRHRREGAGKQQRGKVVQGLYCAIEVCTLRERRRGADRALGGGGEGASTDGGAGVKEGENQAEEEIEWIMSTASDACGNLPMWMQRLAMPSQLPKDVRYFMKWIQSVDEKDVEDAVGDWA